MHIKKCTHSCTVDSCCHRYRPPALLLSSCVCKFGHRSAWSGKSAVSQQLWLTWTQKHQKETKTREKMLRATHLLLGRELNITAHYSQHSHATSSWKDCNCSLWAEAIIKHTPLNSTGKSDSFKGIGSFVKTNDSLVQLSCCGLSCFQLYI